MTSSRKAVIGRSFIFGRDDSNSRSGLSSDNQSSENHDKLDTVFLSFYANSISYLFYSIVGNSLNISINYHWYNLKERNQTLYTSCRIQKKEIKCISQYHQVSAALKWNLLQLQGQVSVPVLVPHYLRSSVSPLSALTRKLKRRVSWQKLRLHPFTPHLK